MIADFRRSIRIAAEERYQIVDGGSGDIVQGLVGQESLVRGDDDIGHGNQANQLVILHDVTGEVLIEQVALFFINVQTGCTHFFLLNAIDQIFRIDQTATGIIEDGNAFLHPGDGLSVDDMLGILGQGAVQGNNVGLFKQFRKIYIVQIGVGSGEFVVGQDVHAEAFADIGKNPSDFTGSDNTYRLAVQVKSCQSLKAEIELPGTVVGFVGAPVNGQQQCHGVLGNGVRRVSGNSEYPEFPLTGFDIYIVETGAAQDNGFYTQLVKLFNNGGIDGIIYKYAHRIKASSQGDSIFIEIRLKIFNFHTGRNTVTVKAGNIISFGIKELNEDRYPGA